MTAMSLPLTTRAFADLVATEIDRPVRLRATVARTLWLLCSAVPPLREAAGVAYQWERSFIADDSAFRDAFSVPPRPAAITATVAWFRRRPGVPVTAGS